MSDLNNKESLDNFVENLKEFNICLGENQVNQFVLYYDMLIEWNSFMNLTAITEFDEVLQKHFTDSLSLIKAVSDLGEKEYEIIDVGTGAGFPGIPLKIAFPDLKITLLDSLNKRVKFLNKVIESLGLVNIEAIHGRAEDFSKENLLREKFDICVSRAVAHMAVLSEYCIPFVKQNGYFISYKSDKTEEEFEKSKNAIEILGGSYIKNITFTLPDSDIVRTLYIIMKKDKTPLKYPRKAGIPVKEPL